MAQQQQQFAGWLVKEGGIMKNLKKRFFVLQKGSLFYFKNQKNKKHLGCISMNDVMLVQPVGKRKNTDFCLEVVTGKRNWYFWAESEADAEQWLTHLRAAMEAAKGGSSGGLDWAASSQEASLTTSGSSQQQPPPSSSTSSTPGGGGGGGDVGGGGVDIVDATPPAASSSSSSASIWIPPADAVQMRLTLSVAAAAHSPWTPGSAGDGPLVGHPLPPPPTRRPLADSLVEGGLVQPPQYAPPEAELM